MSPVEYLWSVLEDGTIGIEESLSAAEILDNYYGLKRSFGQLQDPNRDALEKIRSWASQVACAEEMPHKFRIRAAKLALAR